MSDLKISLKLLLQDQASEQAIKRLAEVGAAARSSGVATAAAGRSAETAATANASAIGRISTEVQRLAASATTAQNALYNRAPANNWAAGYAQQITAANTAAQRAWRQFSPQALPSSAGVLSRQIQQAQALTQHLEQASAAAQTLAQRMEQAGSANQARTGATRALATATQDVASAGRVLANTPVPQGWGEWLRQAAANSRVISGSLNALRAANRATPGQVVGGLTSAAGGLMAARAVVSEPLKQAMDHKTALAHMANTAWAGQSLATRTAGIGTLETAIMSGVRAGGGTREQVREALDIMIARNNLGNANDAATLLPLVTKSATAGNANPAEIAALAGTVVKTGKIAVGDVGKAIGMALYGGQVGGFELRNMAKWLPEQMAMAGNIGITGLDGMAHLVALNELAINAAGSPDQAGNNVRDFVHEIGATNTANHLKHYSYDKKNNTLVEKVGKHKGDNNYIDMGHMLAKNQQNGMNAIESTLGLMSMVLKGDPAYRAIQQRLKEARARGDTEAQMAEMQKAQQILAGRGIGKIFHNQQSMLGGIGAILDPEGYRQLVDKIRANGNENTINDSFALIASQPGFKKQQADQEREHALQNGLQGATQALGAYSEKLSEVYQKYPTLSSSLETAALAAKAFAAAAAAGAAAGLLGAGLRGGSAVAAAGSVAGLAGTASLWTGGALAAGTGGWLAGGLIGDVTNWAGQKANGNKHWTYGSAIYDLFNQEENAALAAQQVTMLPQKGHAGQADLKSVVREIIDAQGKAPLQVNVMLDGRQIAATVNDHNGSMMRRY